MQQLDQFTEALCREIELRKTEVTEPVETIYFGGGTPSVLSVIQIEQILNKIKGTFNVSNHAELTLEGNPDDLTPEKLSALKAIGINRLSIGVQSFADDHLKWMNRTHDAKASLKVIADARRAGFSNITIDLIYGVPGMTSQQWKHNLETAFELGIDHISSYALTVEKKTALAHFIKKGSYENPSEELAAQHFEILTSLSNNAGFEQYEISNFARNKKYSEHNSNYWKGKSYLGLGPSAHSYNGIMRSWNVANNTQYIKSIAENKLPSESETLTPENVFNEYLMTGLRTMWGCEVHKLQTDFARFYKKIEPNLETKMAHGLITLDHGWMKLTSKGKFLADGIASDLFV